MTVSENTKKAYESRLDTCRLDFDVYWKLILRSEGHIGCHDLLFEPEELGMAKQMIEVMNDKYFDGSMLGLDSPSDKATLKRVIKRYTNPETKKGYLSALMWACKDKESPAFKTYHEEFDKVKKICNDRAREQKLPENRQQNYLKKDELVELYQKCYTNFLATGKDYYDHLILALYIIQPPVRCDYVKMRFVDDAQMIELTSEKNWCVMNKTEKCYFVFNKYKTATTYGTRCLPIEKDLQDLLRLHYYVRKEAWVLPEHWDENYLSRRVRDICAVYTEKKCSIGLIRHAWVFDLYKTNPTLKEKEELARRMLHSVAVQELYRTAENIDQLSLEE